MPSSRTAFKVFLLNPMKLKIGAGDNDSVPISNFRCKMQLKYVLRLKIALLCCFYLSVNCKHCRHPYLSSPGQIFKICKIPATKPIFLSNVKHMGFHGTIYFNEFFTFPQLKLSKEYLSYSKITLSIGLI